MTAAPFLVEQLGPTARIAVQVAWGADVTAAYATWTWTDITEDVRIKDGINLKHGRSDEASDAQPASCSLVLDNSTGAYSLGGQSPNWPNVQKNTPVRVRVDAADGSGLRTLFVGYADSWQPSWNQAASVAEVSLTASGILRRLAQHRAPVLSSLRRRLSTESNVVAYWPLEEGKLATEGLSAFPGHPAMIPAGVVEFAGDTDTFASTVQMPVLKNGALYSTVPVYTFTPTSGQQFRCLMTFPENGSGMTDNGIIVRLQLGRSSLGVFDVLYGTGGSLKVQGYSVSGGTATQVINSGAVAFDANGQDVRFYIELVQVGANITWKVGFQTPGAGGGFTSGTLASANLGVITSINLGAALNINGMAVGHVTVQNAVTSVFTDAKELNAFEGEVSHTRFTRLTGENGIESAVIGDSSTFSLATDKMGEQRPEPLLTLLQQIQAVDRGIIYDGTVSAGGGLLFASRRWIENGQPALIIDVGAAKLGGILKPVDDDQGLLNRAVATRQDGAIAVYEDVDGPLGTSSVGIYDASLTIPVASDEAALQYASWLVALGTVEGYRYPSIELDLASTPELIPAMQLLRPGHRIDLVNIADVASQHPDRDVRLVVQGFEQTLTPYSWTVTLNCTPFAPWNIGRTVEATGLPTSPYTDGESLRLDTAGSQTASSASAGATSLSVATTSGPLWTTTAYNFPFDIEVGGIVVTVTAVSGASSPQTFTVTGVVKALASGLDVKLYSPLAPGL